MTLLPDGGCPDPTVAPIYDGVSQCLSQAAATAKCEATSAAQSPGQSATTTTCGAGCTCTYCASEMFQCATDPDCTKILLCAQANNCTGTDCYTPTKCQGVIDHADGDAGISSNAVAIVQLVSACATKTAIGTIDYSTRNGPACAAGCQ